MQRDREELEIFLNDCLKEKIRNIWEKMMLYRKDFFRDKFGFYENVGVYVSIEIKRVIKMDLEKKECRGLRGNFQFLVQLLGGFKGKE